MATECDYDWRDATTSQPDVPETDGVRTLICVLCREEWTEPLLPPDDDDSDTFGLSGRQRRDGR